MLEVGTLDAVFVVVIRDTFLGCKKFMYSFRSYVPGTNGKNPNIVEIELVNN